MMLELNNYYIQELENLTDLFTNIFGKGKIYYNDVFHSVAYGLSLANI